MDELPSDDEVEATITPKVFFETIRIRELLAGVGRPVRTSALVRFMKIEAAELACLLSELERAKLIVDGANRGWRLTDEGLASVRWSAPPPPDGRVTYRWVGEVARACAAHYGVEFREMLKAEVGPGVIARTRLCFALYARGWNCERIEEHLSLPPGWARRAVERWKRLRDQVLPRTGAELRAWRLRLGLTQAQAADRLGVSRRTVIRAERTGTLPSRSAIGQA